VVADDRRIGSPNSMTSIRESLMVPKLATLTHGEQFV
jgi:hypothetical protein